MLLPYAIVSSTDTLGWRFTFSPTALSEISYFVTWRVRLISESTNSVVSSFYVGSKAAKWIFALLALVGLSIVAFLPKTQKYGMVATIIKWIRKLGFKPQVVTGRKDKIRELDAEIYSFYNRDR